jgi:fluoride exporter
MLVQFAAVGAGAAIGAWLRWGLGAWLNPRFPTLPLGTLSANLVGGLAMGIVMEVATRHALLSPEARLFVTTGFLGGLTTFSTFSAEAATLVTRGEWLWAVGLIASHVIGSILLTLAGLWLARLAFAGAAP